MDGRTKRLSRSVAVDGETEKKDYAKCDDADETGCKTKEVFIEHIISEAS